MVAVEQDTRLWQLLWSHAADQAVNECAQTLMYEPVAAGYGHGLRHPQNPRQALLVHPSATARDVGDLSLTVLGEGTQVIPRCGSSYTAYLATVRDIVETVSQRLR